MHRLSSQACTNASRYIREIVSLLDHSSHSNILWFLSLLMHSWAQLFDDN